MAIPKGFNSLSFYLIVSDVHAAMDLYVKAFDGEGGVCMLMPDGSVMHAEMKIGNSTFMLTQENPAWEQQGPHALGGTPVGVHLYVDSVEDVDRIYQQATEAGMTGVMPPADQFWGDRYARLQDPFGHNWGVASQFKELTPEELEAGRDVWLAEMAAQGQCPPDAADA